MPCDLHKDCENCLKHDTALRAEYAPLVEVVGRYKLALFSGAHVTSLVANQLRAEMFAALRDFDARKG